MNKRINDFINTDPILPLLDDWKHFIDKIKFKYTICIITAYPNQLNRIHNLSLHNIDYHKIVFVKQNEKVDTIKELNPLYIFDDCPNIINKMNIKTFVPNRWNYVQHLKILPHVFLYNKLDDIEI